jgi:hypothetical protein
VKSKLLLVGNAPPERALAVGDQHNFNRRAQSNRRPSVMRPTHTLRIGVSFVRSGLHRKDATRETNSSSWCSKTIVRPAG